MGCNHPSWTIPQERWTEPFLGPADGTAAHSVRTVCVTALAPPRTIVRVIARAAL